MDWKCIQILDTIERIKESGQPAFIAWIPNDSSGYTNTFMIFKEIIKPFIQNKTVRLFELNKGDMLLITLEEKTVLQTLLNNLKDLDENIYAKIEYFQMMKEYEIIKNKLDNYFNENESNQAIEEILPIIPAYIESLDINTFLEKHSILSIKDTKKPFLNWIYPNIEWENHISIFIQEDIQSIFLKKGMNIFNPDKNDIYTISLAKKITDFKAFTQFKGIVFSLNEVLLYTTLFMKITQELKKLNILILLKNDTNCLMNIDFKKIPFDYILSAYMPELLGKIEMEKIILTHIENESNFNQFAKQGFLFFKGSFIDLLYTKIYKQQCPYNKDCALNYCQKVYTHLIKDMRCLKKNEISKGQK